MATFSVIDASLAPPQHRPSSPLRERMSEYEGFVRMVKGGHVGRLVASASENERSLMLRVGRAATRIGKAVDSWAVDGIVYFKVV